MIMKCKNCDENIDEDEDQIVEAIINFTRQFCHLQCFRCGVCNELLTGLYFEKNGVLYCRKDYYNKYAERCQFCRNFMTGPVMVVGSEIKFHPECFKCEACSSIIGDDESYAYVDRSKLYCNQCFQRQTNERASSHETSVRFQKRPSDSNNAIQVIEIPPLSNGRQRRIKLALRDYHCCNLINCSCNSNNSNRRNGKLSIGPVNNNSTVDADTTVLSLDDATKTDGARLPDSNGSKIKRAYCLNSNTGYNDNHCNSSINRNISSCPAAAATSHGDNSSFLLSDANFVSATASTSTAAVTAVQTNLNSNGAGVHISEIDVNYDLDLLHIGDRILEVNGISIKDKSLLDIEKLIEKSRDQVIHLTVENKQSSQSQQSSTSISTSSSPSSSSFLSDLILSSNNFSNESFDELNDSSSSLVNSGQKLVGDYCDENVFKIVETLPVTSTTTIVTTTTTAKVSSTTTTTSSTTPISNNNILNNSSNTNNLKHDKLSENSESISSIFSCRYANSSSDNQNTAPTTTTNCSDTSTLSLSSSNNLTSKPSLRPNSLHATTGLDSVNSETSNGTLYPPITPSKSMDNTRKSRSLEKRIRNRERSSSLSRLIESIRLTSNDTPSDICDSSLTSPIVSNNSSLNTLTSSYFTPSRNGFPSPNKLNNSLSRTKSFRVEPKSYRVFRATDLVKGSLLGKGFFGEVFEVTDKVTKEKMVLKELHHNDREAEANFVREVSILKSLNHKNVLHFIGILYRGKKLNLITEYITGGTLRQLIQDETKPIYWPERFIWARDIASGVNYLHSMNLIHRDLNSQNCLVRDDGTVVVADFGLSKITSVNSYGNQNDENNENGLSNQQSQKLNRRRDRRKRYTIVGNPFWMAPEMMHRNKYDERVDIYSFGIILLEVIGSVNADPDVLKRNRDFSVDKKYFLDNYVKDMCPEIFWRIAFLSTEMNPDMRPPFNLLEHWLQQITTILDNHHQTAAVAATSASTATNNSLSTSSSSVLFNYNELIPSELMAEVIGYNNNNSNNNGCNGSNNCLTNNSNVNSNNHSATGPTTILHTENQITS